MSVDFLEPADTVRSNLTNECDGDVVKECTTPQNCERESDKERRVRAKEGHERETERHDFLSLRGGEHAPGFRLLSLAPSLT